MRCIYYPGNDYLFHIDEKADRACHDSANELAKEYPNTTVVKSTSVIWGGVSILNAILALIEQSLLVYADWDYFIFLSGQDFPIKKQEEIIKELDQKKGFNYIEYFDPLLKKDWGTASDRIEMLHFEIPFLNRVKKIPLIRIGNPLGKIKWFGGGQYSMLTRSFCEYIIHDPYPKRIRKSLKFSFAPEESFFQTVAMNSEYKSSTINDIKRMIVWDDRSSHPHTFTKEDYQDLIKSDAYFGRKFDETIDSEIISMLEDHILGRQTINKS